MKGAVSVELCRDRLREAQKAARFAYMKTEVGNLDHAQQNADALLGVLDALAGNIWEGEPPGCLKRAREYAEKIAEPEGGELREIDARQAALSALMETQEVAVAAYADAAGAKGVAPEVEAARRETEAEAEAHDRVERGMDERGHHGGR